RRRDGLPLPRRAELRLRRLAGDDAALPRAPRRGGDPRLVPPHPCPRRHVPERDAGPRLVRRRPIGVSDADPVSWLVVERGWSVVAADGTALGNVAEVIGDTGKDIFNGISVSAGLLKRPKY